MVCAMKRVLVTGANGFIGRHCLAPLIASGYEIHAVSHSRARTHMKGVIWYAADLLDPITLARLMSEVRPSHLMHLAWYADPSDYRESPENLAWVRASVDLVRCFAESGGRRAVFAGTCFEYGPDHGYCVESSTPEAPSTLYAACKNSLRQIVLKYSANVGVSAAWARIFYLYGPFEPSARLVPSVILSLLRGGRASCTHGRQLRDFLHVEDVASALVAVLDSPARDSINIGSGEPVSIHAVVEMIAGGLDAIDRVDFGALDPLPDDASMRVAGVDRLSKEVGWRSRWSLEEGLTSTIQWWTAKALQRESAEI